MRIWLHKISNARHALEIERADGSRDRVECETRSYLVHDFLHLAVEAEAGLEDGFWGRLAAGAALAELNDRDAPPPEGMMWIEQVVGALTSAAKGRAAADVVSGFRRYAEQISIEMPTWLSEELVLAVQERMRRLQGHWRATPFGESMQITWPPKQP